MDNINKKLKVASITIMVFIIIFIGFILFNNTRTPKEDVFLAKIYFLNPSTNELEYEARELPIREDALMVEDVLKEFSLGPNKSHLIKTFPQDVQYAKGEVKLRRPPIDSDSLNQSERIKTIEIKFTKEYKELLPAEEIMFRTSLVYTLTELPFVKGVEIFIQNDDDNDAVTERLTQGNNQPIGVLNRENILNLPEITSEKLNTKKITLYFPNGEVTGLLGESRNIIIPSTTDALEEKAILEQLIKGPTLEGAVNLLPQDIQIIDVKITDKVCYIDLNMTIDSKIQKSEQGIKMLTYSIVNTLILADTDIRSVQFLVNGDKVEAFMQPFEADESLIINQGQLS